MPRTPELFRAVKNVRVSAEPARAVCSPAATAVPPDRLAVNAAEERSSALPAAAYSLDLFTVGPPGSE
jgi:hypothetical protein